MSLSAKLEAIDPDLYDEALERCILSLWDLGIYEADAIVVLGVSLVAYGLAVHARDHGSRDVPALRAEAKRGIDAAEIVDLMKAAAA